MNESENITTSQTTTREVDALISASNEALRREYNTAMVTIIKYNRTHSGASQREKNDFLSALSVQYKANVENVLSSLEKEYRKSVVATYAHLWDVKPQAVSADISVDKKRIIASAVRAFDNEAKLLMDTRSSVVRPFTIRDEYADFENSLGKSEFFGSTSKLSKWNIKTYGVPSVDKDSQGILESLIARCTVEEDYAMRTALLADVPQVVGYRVEVAKTNKYGKSRKKDICDVLAGDYPKAFQFRGWHYNCRCVLRPLVDKNYITPAMIASGCIAVEGNAKIALSDAARSFLVKNAGEYQKAFPSIAQSVYVDYNGEKRFLADMGVHEKTSFYMGDMIKNSDFFPKMKRNIAVSNKEFSSKRVYMETTQKADVYQIAMSEKMEKNLISAFAKKGTGIALTTEEMHATGSALHEMIHNLVQDYTEQQTIKSGEVDILSAINYHRGLGIEREIMEVFTEWKMRSIYSDVMSSYGLTLRSGYATAISRGYNHEVNNFNAFLGKVNDPQLVKNMVDEFLAKPNKARVYMEFKDALKAKGLVKPNANMDLLMDVLVYERDEKEYNYVMDNLLQKTPVAKATPAAVALVVKNKTMADDVGRSLADFGWGDNVKKIGDVDVHSNGLMLENAVLKNMAKGVAVVGGAVVMTEGVKRGLDVKEEQDKRYLPKVYYKDSYDDALMCGFIDGAASLVDMGRDMVTSVGLYSILAVGSGLSKFPVFGEKINSKLKEMSGAFTASQMGVASTVEDVADFTSMYACDAEFRTAVNDTLWRECKDYFSAMGGVSPENGYRQGRAVFDLINLLAGAGMLKNVMTVWRRTKRLDEMTRVLRLSKMNMIKRTLPVKY
ncbi:MAG: hypothetical protein PHD21_06655 [Flavobacteriales bacterium]|nr:hypothetical protein [Flavobacteriales bacterium]